MSQFIPISFSELMLAEIPLFPLLMNDFSLLLNKSLIPLLVGYLLHLLHLSWRGLARTVHLGVTSIQFKKRGLWTTQEKMVDSSPFGGKQSNPVNSCSAVAIWTRPTYICKNNLRSSHWRGNKDFYFFLIQSLVEWMDIVKRIPYILY